MSWWYVGATAVSVAASYDQSNNAQHNVQEAADSQASSNEAALAQQQAQFEASQALQQQIAEMQIASQEGIANRQIEAAQQQFAEVQRVLQPFITAGNESLSPLRNIENTGQQALGGQRALLGLDGAAAQQAAINGLQNNPEMAAYLQQGENAMLQNAAATGGLRGGNTQAAMAQFRPQLLSGMISQQYDRLGGLTSLGANTSSMLYQSGQSAAAGVGNAGMQVAGQIGSALSNYSQGVGNAYGQLSKASAAGSAGLSDAYQNYYDTQGAIAAGSAISQGNIGRGFSNSVMGALGSYSALQAMKGSGLNSNPNIAGLGPQGYSLAGGYSSSLGLQSTGGTGLKF